MSTLAGKIAIITGGARGQGEAHARRFVAEGAKVVIGDILEAEGNALADELGDAAVFAPLDVASEQAWSDAVDIARSSFGDPTVLVNNAGIVRHASLLDEELAHWQRVLDINLTGCWLGIRAVAPAMPAGGSIINISSNAGIIGYAGVGAYVASKWGLRGLTKAAALELGPAGIRVNSVHPGVIDTPMLKFDPSSSRVFDGQPIARAGKPHEIANVVRFLASDESSYMSGAELTVDGGMVVGSVPPSSRAGAA
ncbi:glucose 1-dehydrogenase [Rhodococcus sp. NPDC059968]|uniref:glucose 1-dehydrogenase n=1 Tax=Rhodococcus sp. NPDC059968 TaxID=3347017 RepID=UPI00366DB3CB